VVTLQARVSRVAATAGTAIDISGTFRMPNVKGTVVKLSSTNPNVKPTACLVAEYGVGANPSTWIPVAVIAIQGATDPDASRDFTIEASKMPHVPFGTADAKMRLNLVLISANTECTFEAFVDGN
jgi:hypothetical protein